jgi:methionyl-tRNA formyltransferase
MRVGFFGQTGPFAPPVLRYLVARGREVELGLVVEGKRVGEGRPDHRLRPGRPGLLPLGDNLGELARAAGIPVLETSDVNHAEAVAALAEHQLDWIVCAGFDRLFVPAVLATARHGGLNLHPSLLPRWRGPSPLFWALRSGERATGITIHAIDEREDHGAMYAQAPFVIPPRVSGEELYRLAAVVSAPLLVEVLSRSRAGPLDGRAQDEGRATRAPRPRAEDVHIVPHEWACEHVVDFCCGATFFRSPWLRLDDHVVVVERGLAAEPGGRLRGDYELNGRQLVMQCRDGLARVEVRV